MYYIQSIEAETKNSLSITRMKNKREIFIWIILITLSTAFSFAIGKGDMNFILIGVMSLLPIFMIMQYPRFFVDEFLIYLLFISLVFCGLRHPASFRISTIMYSLLFILTFIYALRLIYSGVLQSERFLLIIKIIITAYCVTLIIQQVCVLLGSSYVFNQIHTWDESAFKLNALSPEPSHTSRILFFLMYSYICTREAILKRSYQLTKDWKDDMFVWGLFLYSLLTMRSGTAILFLPIFFMKFMKLKNLFYIIPMILILGFAITKLDITPVKRVVAFSKAVITLDPSIINEADNSAAMRVVPTIQYFKMFDITKMDTWFGRGIDFDKEIFPIIIPGVPVGVSVGGIFPTFLMNFGLVPIIILLLMINKFCFRAFFSFDTLLWLLMIGPNPFNTQLVWLTFILLGINKYYLTKSLE